MGRNKALLRARGEPLVSIVARSVAEAAGNIAIVGDPAIYGGLGLRVVPDRYPGEGPLGGIITALHDAGAGWS